MNVFCFLAGFISHGFLFKLEDFKYYCAVVDTLEVLCLTTVYARIIPSSLFLVFLLFYVFVWFAFFFQLEVDHISKMYKVRRYVREVEILKTRKIIASHINGTGTVADQIVSSKLCLQSSTIIK